jgi:hypothetical protein
MSTKIIGTGGDYTTITAWEAALPATLTEPEIGTMLGQAFTENVAFAGVTTSAANYIELRPVSGAEHRGLSFFNVGSPGGVARIVSLSAGSATILITSINYIRLLDFEIIGGGSVSFARHGISFGGTFSSPDIRILRLLLWNDGGNTNFLSRGVNQTVVSSSITVGRCIIYNFGGPGIHYVAGTLTFDNNTVVACNRSASASVDQINIAGSAGTFVNNVACSPNGGEDFTNPQPSGNTFTYNASSDASAIGLGCIQLITTADQFNDPTVVDISLTDLRIKAGAIIRDVGTTLSSPFDVGIRGNIVSGPWDIGADEFGEGVDTGGQTGTGSRPWSYQGNWGAARPWCAGITASRPKRGVLGASRP